MAESKTWILTDTDAHVWHDHFEILLRNLNLPAANRAAVRKKTLRGGLSDGVDLVEIDNGELSLSVLPTRGMGIWKGQYRDLELGWQSPAKGPVNPQFVNLGERGGLGWLAGFDEMIVRCGLDSNGAPTTDVVPNNMGEPAEVELTLHGKIANIPASRVEVHITPGDPPQIAVVGEVCEASLFCPGLRLRSTVSTRCGSNAFTLVDEVSNLKATPSEMELLYHCNFGAPFLEEGSHLETPATLVAPRDPRAVEGINTYAQYLAPTPGYVEQVYWYEPLADGEGNTLAMLRNAAADKAVAIRFNTNQLPCFTQWKNTAAQSDGYVTGLEPGTDYPNTKTFERQQGRLVTLPPGATYRSEITLEIHDSATAVAAVQQEIAQIQQTAALTVHREPLNTLSG